VELPHIEQLYRELKDQGFLVVSIVPDAPDTVKTMRDYYGITHAYLRDSVTREKVETTWDGKPVTYYQIKTQVASDLYQAYEGKQYFIDGRTGKIVAAYSKIGLTVPRIRQFIAKMGVKDALKPPPPPDATTKPNN
jgi:hypothetical protein